METLRRRYELLHNTHDIIDTLYESLEIINNPTYKPIYRTCRDSVIQRFEYSIDSLWKFLKVYLQDELSVTFKVISPREVFRVASENKLISPEEFEVMLECIAARNLTSHTYKEEEAEKLVKRVPSCCDTMQTIIDRIKV